MIKDLKIVTEEHIKLDKREIHKLIGKLKSSEKFNIKSLQVNFVNSNYISEINEKYLNHNYSTDIITFNYSGSHSELDGEIFISIQDALDNAHRFTVNFGIELLRLIIHGILHLLGYDDTMKQKKLLMKKKEDELVSKYQSEYGKIIINYDS